MPETSVLIPTYNCAKYIAEAINSVVAQSYSDFEVIVIDDGSSDNTRDVISSIRDSRIRFFSNESNLGVAETLNRGLGLACGEFIARMDADDVMLGNRLDEQVRFLRSYPDFGLVGGWYQVVDEQGNFQQLLRTHCENNFLNLGLKFRNQFAHSAVTMRTELASQLKYSLDFPYCEDHELWIRFSEITRIANLPSNYLSYRWYGENSCNSNQKQLRMSVLKLLSRELDKLGVDHDETDLMLHSAVCFGIAPTLLRKISNQQKLFSLHDKIFSSPSIIGLYDQTWLSRFRKEILFRYCGMKPLSE